MLHLVGCLCYLYQWCTVKHISDNEIYLLIKYIKSVLCRVAKCLSYIEETRCLKVNYAIHGACLRMVLLTDVYRNLTSLWIKPRECAFKQFKSRVLNVLIQNVSYYLFCYIYCMGQVSYNFLLQRSKWGDLKVV